MHVRQARVRLIDIGMDDSFDLSMSFAQSLIHRSATATTTTVISS
jgi:hypothetical protein